MILYVRMQMYNMPASIWNVIGYPYVHVYTIHHPCVQCGKEGSTIVVLTPFPLCMTEMLWRTSTSNTVLFSFSFLRRSQGLGSISPGESNNAPPSYSVGHWSARFSSIRSTSSAAVSRICSGLNRGFHPSSAPPCLAVNVHLWYNSQPGSGGGGVLVRLTREGGEG
jgi:hypothetical protein